MSVYVKTKDGKLKPIREDVTAEEIKNALGYTPANEDDITVTKEDITEALGYTPADANAVPDVDLSDVEDGDNTFYIVDKNGYKIAQIDAEGIHTTTVNAKEVSLGSSLLLKEHLEDAHSTDSKRHVSDEDRKRWNANTAGTDQGITDIENKIDKHIDDDNRHKTAAEQAAIDADDEGKTFVIVDKDGYKIAEFDAAGLHVLDLLLGASGKSIGTLIEEKVGEVDLSGYYKKSETYSRTEVDTKVSGKQDTLAFDGTYNKDTNKAATVQTVIDKVAEIVANAPEDFNTLKELSDWLTSHEGSAATMNSAIQENAQAIEAMKEKIVSDQEEFHIVDANDNIVATIDKDGVHSVAAYVKSVPEEDTAVPNKKYVNDLVSSISQSTDVPDTLGLEYTLSDDGTAYTCVSLGTATFGIHLKIPATYNGKPVTAIGDNAFIGNRFKSITLPNSIVSIGMHAFNGVSTDSDVLEIPDTVKTLGNAVFQSCLIKNIKLGNGITSIGTSLFNSCTRIERIDLPKSLTTLSAYTFSGCSALKLVTIPSSVTTVGYRAFLNCNEALMICCEASSVGGTGWNTEWNPDGYAVYVNTASPDVGTSVRATAAEKLTAGHVYAKSGSIGETLAGVSLEAGKAYLIVLAVGYTYYTVSLYVHTSDVAIYSTATYNGYYCLYNHQAKTLAFYYDGATASVSSIYIREL